MNLTIGQVAERLGVATGTVRDWRWRHNAGLPLAAGIPELCELFFKVGAQVRMSEDDLRAWRAKPYRIRRVSHPDTPEFEFSARLTEISQELRVAGHKLAAELALLAATAVGR